MVKNDSVFELRLMSLEPKHMSDMLTIKHDDLSWVSLDLKIEN